MKIRTALFILFLFTVIFYIFASKVKAQPYYCYPPSCSACFLDTSHLPQVVISCQCLGTDCMNEGCLCCNDTSCWDCSLCDDEDTDPSLAENKFLIFVDSDKDSNFSPGDEAVGYQGGTICPLTEINFENTINIVFSTSQDDGSIGNLYYHGLCFENKPCSKNYMKCSSANCTYYFLIQGLPPGYSAIKMRGCALVDGIFNCPHHERDSEEYEILLSYTPPAPNLCTVSGEHYMSSGAAIPGDPDDIGVSLFNTDISFSEGSKTGLLYEYTNIEPGNYRLSVFNNSLLIDSDGYKDPDSGLIDSSNIYDFTLDDLPGCSVNVDWYWSLKDIEPWWQTGDGDVVATGGGIDSSIPDVCSTPLCLEAMSLFKADESSAGVMMCADDSSVNSGAGEISMDRDQNLFPNWNASADLTKLNGMNYDFFERKLDFGDYTPLFTEYVSSSDLNNLGTYTKNPEGYYIFLVDNTTDVLRIGDSTDIDIGDNKVIILFEGEVNIEKNINITDGKGFFMVVAGNGGDIKISRDIVYIGSPTYSEEIPNIEGILFAEGKVYTGTKGDGQDGALYIRGMVAGINGIEMQRSLPDNSQGAGQYFKFAPDLLFNYPRILTSKKTVWREVAP